MQFSFHDSEVRGCTPQGTALAIVFSAAAVQLPDARSGYAQPLRMVLEDAAWQGPLGECVGRLWEGRLWDAQTRHAELALPYVSAGPVRLELRFANGVQLEVHASACNCRLDDGAQFVESFAC